MASKPTDSPVTTIRSIFELLNTPENKKFLDAPLEFRIHDGNLNFERTAASVTCLSDLPRRDYGEDMGGMTIALNVYLAEHSLRKNPRRKS